MSDAYRATSDLGRAMEAATSSASGLSNSFAELAENGKVWTIMSRVISGTGMWQLQNKIRALGQTMFYWNTMQEKGITNQIKSLEANMKLASSYKDVAQAMKKSNADIQKTDIYAMFKNQGEMKGLSDPSKFAMGKYKEMYGGAEKILGGQLAKVGKKNTALEYIKGANIKTNKAGRLYDSNTGRLKARADVTTTKDFLKSMNPLSKFAKGELKLSKIKKKVLKVGGLIAPTLGRLVLVASAFFVQAVVYFLLIALGIALIVKLVRNSWPTIKKLLDEFGVVKTLINGVKLVLGGFFQMFKGIFKGNFSDVIGGFLKIMYGLGKVLFAILKGVFALLLGVMHGLLKTIVNSVLFFLNKIPGVDIKKFAMGGVYGSGGMALVGERGPELVNLPAGARVHNNQDSRRMGGGGNTINVHVNGRVGASDTEIRDIAQKVAREINLQMNRTSSAVGRF